MPLRELREAHEYAKIIFETVERMEQYVTKIPLRLPRLSEDSGNAAQLTRSALGFSPDTPISNLINEIERRGVLVLALPIVTKKLDAFSAWVGSDTPRPVIAISGGRPGDRLRFSVAHELGHLVLHKTIKGELSNVEREASRFAGEFLMPEEAMRQEIVPPVRLLSLAKLKPRWKVSIQALIRRAHDLNIINQRQYKYLMQQLSIRGWRKKEPSNLDLPAERPRGLSKMVELLYGAPIDYKKLASDMYLPKQLIRKIIEANAGKDIFTFRGEPAHAAKVEDLESFRKKL